MSEINELNEARQFALQNEREKATEILWRLYKSENLIIRLNAILVLIVVLDRISENDMLIETTNEGVKIAEEIGNADTRAYLLARKCVFLRNRLGFLIYRQKNLILAGNVFKWIGFSTEADEEEFKIIKIKREQTEHELIDSQSSIIEIAEKSINHYLRGYIYWGLAEVYSSKFLEDQIDLMSAGKNKSRIGNMYFVKRLGLDKIVIFNKADRNKINNSKKTCISFFIRAISELEIDKKEVDLAHIFYSFAVTLKMMYKFRRAKMFLDKARILARKYDEKTLLNQIDEFEKQLAGKNRYDRDYVAEFGLDLPRGVQGVIK